MISYAGIPLLQPDVAVLERLEQGTVLDGLRLFGQAPEAADPVRATPCWPDPQDPARLGVLYWPQGASRFAWGLYLAGEEQLARIREYVLAPQSGPRQAELVLDDGRHSVTAPLWMLPSRPLEKVEGLPGAHLIALADDRFWWRARAASVQVTSGQGATWADLYAAIGTALGVTIYADDVDAAYGTPDESWWCNYEGLPELLDAVAAAVGHRVVRELDGTVRALSASSSLTRLRANQGAATARLSGGRLSLARRPDADLALPSAVAVCYGGVAAGDPAGISEVVTPAAVAALADLAGYLDWASVRGVPGATQVLRRAESYPASDVSSAALALRAAGDWLAHQLGPEDECFEGACSWQMEGLTALLEYEHLPGAVRTRARRPPWAAGLSRQGQGAVVLGGGSTTYLDSQTTYAGGSTLALADGSTQSLEGGEYFQSESGAYLAYQDGRLSSVYVLDEWLLEDGSSYLAYEDGSSALFAGRPPVLLRSTTLYVEGGDSDLVVASGSNLTFRGDPVTFSGGGLVLCAPWWFCYGTTTQTTDTTGLEISTSTAHTDVDFSGSSIRVRGITPPTVSRSGTPRMRHTITNVGTDTPRFIHEDPSAPAVDRIRTPGGTDYPLPPGAKLTIHRDPTLQRWVIPDFPAVARPGVPGGQTVTGGTGSADQLTIASTTDATKGGIAISPGDWLVLPEITAPGTPSAGTVVLYPKSDGKVYAKDDAGTEYDLTGSGSSPTGSGTANTLVKWTGASTLGDSGVTDDGVTVVSSEPAKVRASLTVQELTLTPAVVDRGVIAAAGSATSSTVTVSAKQDDGTTLAAASLIGAAADGIFDLTAAGKTRGTVYYQVTDATGGASGATGSDAAGNAYVGGLVVTVQSSAAAARANLGLAVGTDVQAHDADLDALAALSGTDTIYYRSGASTWSAVTVGSNLTFSAGTLSATGSAGALLAADNLSDLADAATARTNLGVAIGTDVQAHDADLDALAALSSTAGLLARTGAGAFAVRTLTGTAGQVTVTNGTGASADPTISLPATITQAETLKVTDAGTANATSNLTIDHDSSGAPALGFGAQIVAALKTTTTSSVQAGYLQWLWGDATHATRQPAVSLVCTDATGDHAIMTGGTDGAGTHEVAFLGATPVARQTGSVGTGLVNLGLFSGTPTFAAANLTGTTLASSVVTSSITTVGTLTGGATGAGFTVALTTSTVSGTLPAANMPALTGAVVTTAGAVSTSVSAGYLRGWVDGLILSDNGAASTTLNYGAGACRDSTDAYNLILSAGTKLLAATWAAGSGGNGLDTGAVANSTWYHVHAISKAAGASPDLLFSLSATAPTMPATYTLFRRIGAVFSTAAGKITQFIQWGDHFWWLSPIADVAATNPGVAAVTRTLSVPTGVSVIAQLVVGFNATTPATDNPANVYLSDLSQTDIVGATILCYVNVNNFYAQAQVRTNTSAQIRSRVQISTAGTTLAVNTRGWIDSRGRTY